MNLTSEEKRLNVKNDYNIIASAYADEFGKAYEDLEIIRIFLKDLPANSYILDLGGGTGKLTDLFIKEGYKAVCFDFSEEMRKKALEFFPNIPYVLGDIVNLQDFFTENSFDGIIAFYSLFHVPKEDIKNVFYTMKNILRNNGLLCFVVQLGNSEQLIDEPYLGENGKKILYCNFFDEKELLQLLDDVGFKVEYTTIKSEIGKNELGNICNEKLFVIAKNTK